MNLFLGLVVIMTVVLGLIKLLKAGFRREDARMAATFAAVDRLVLEHDAVVDENVVVMDANLLLNSRLPENADERTLELAHQEYQRLFAEEYDYLLSQAALIHHIRRRQSHQ